MRNVQRDSSLAGLEPLTLTVRLILLEFLVTFRPHFYVGLLLTLGGLLSHVKKIVIEESKQTRAGVPDVSVTAQKNLAKMRSGCVLWHKNDASKL